MTRRPDNAELLNHDARKKAEEMEAFKAWDQKRLEEGGAIVLPSDVIEVIEDDLDYPWEAIVWSLATGKAWAVENLHAAKHGERVITRPISETERAALEAELASDPSYYS